MSMDVCVEFDDSVCLGQLPSHSISFHYVLLIQRSIHLLECHVFSLYTSTIIRKANETLYMFCPQSCLEISLLKLSTLLSTILVYYLLRIQPLVYVFVLRISHSLVLCFFFLCFISVYLQS